MRAVDWLLLIVLSVLWGATFFFVAVALRDLPPLTLVTARVALAALLLAPLALLAGHRLPATLAAWRPYAVLALLNNVAPFTLISYGQTPRKFDSHMRFEHHVSTDARPQHAEEQDLGFRPWDQTTLHQ